MDRKNFEDQVFDTLPDVIMCSNFIRCTFNARTKFDRCNLIDCIFNVNCEIHLSNIISSAEEEARRKEIEG